MAAREIQMLQHVDEVADQRLWPNVHRVCDWTKSVPNGSSPHLQSKNRSDHLATVGAYSTPLRERWLQRASARIALHNVAGIGHFPAAYLSTGATESEREARNDWVIVYTDEPFRSDVRPLRLARSTVQVGSPAKIGRRGGFYFRRGGPWFFADSRA